MHTLKIYIFNLHSHNLFLCMIILRWRRVKELKKLIKVVVSGRAGAVSNQLYCITSPPYHIISYKETIIPYSYNPSFYILSYKETIIPYRSYKYWDHHTKRLSYHAIERHHTLSYDTKGPSYHNITHKETIIPYIQYTSYQIVLTNINKDLRPYIQIQYKTYNIIQRDHHTSQYNNAIQYNIPYRYNPPNNNIIKELKSYSHHTTQNVYIYIYLFIYANFIVVVVLFIILFLVVKRR